MLLNSAIAAPARSSQSELSASIKHWFSNSGNFSIGSIRLRHVAAMHEIYAARDFAPLWSSQGVATDTSKAISKTLLNAQQFGLEPTKYMGRLLHQLAADSQSDKLLQFELTLTDSLCSYFKDLAHGALITPPSGSGWKQGKSKVNSSATIEGFFKGELSFKHACRSLQPSHLQYLNLLETLKHHQTMISSGGWPGVPAGNTLKHGDTSRRVAKLRARLLASGDLLYTNSFNANKFDSTVADALKAFQHRHGLDPDGVLGSKTLEQLNVTLNTRIAQLQTNIDRWRWLPRDLGYTNITVNTAGYDLTFNIGGVAASHMKVVVGKNDKRTPIFSDHMKYMVFNPSWYVPKSIARDLVKNEARRPGWFKRNNFEVRKRSDNTLVSIANANLQPDYFVSAYRLRQLPGSDNAMGGLKFMFPNRYQVYLHDTNAPSLFRKPQRAFSHGCVRVERPVELATQLLQADGRSSAEIDRFLLADHTRKVSLQSPLPVHLTYQTAWVDDTGTTHFRDDVYDYDQHAFSQINSTRVIYAEAELKALASTGLTIVSNTY